MSLPVLQLGTRVLCSLPVNTFRAWPPQLCQAQLPLKSTVGMGACLNHSALFSHQMHFLLHCQRHNSNTCVLEMSKNETVVPNSIFLPGPCPHSTSSYPSASQDILHSFFLFSMTFPSCPLKAFWDAPLSEHHHFSSQPLDPCIPYLFLCFLQQWFSTCSCDPLKTISRGILPQWQQNYSCKVVMKIILQLESAQLVELY